MFIGYSMGFEAVVFLQARCPSCHPTNSVKTLLTGEQGKHYKIVYLLTGITFSLLMLQQNHFLVLISNVSRYLMPSAYPVHSLDLLSAGLVLISLYI